MPGLLEHVNFTVKDPRRTAQRLCELFDWKVRWQGTAMNDGYTVHVGTDDAYVAVYSPGSAKPNEETNYETVGGLNHIGVVVADIADTEKRVRSAGYEPHSHADYEPGRRFYFHDEDGIEFEVVSYSS